MALLKFGAWTVDPRPSGYSVEWNPIVDGYRSAKGDFLGEKINTKDKIIIEWDGLTAAQVATIRGYLVNFYVTVTYQNPETNSERTAKFYTSPIQHKAFKYDTGTGKITYYENVRLSLIEV